MKVLESTLNNQGLSSSISDNILFLEYQFTEIQLNIIVVFYDRRN
jgi:hypothetical protein